MRVGDYVRTKNGHIGKILGFCECTECKNRGFCEPILDTREFYITNLDKECNFEGLKFSPNIIDLIEVGDYVNGCCVTEIDYQNKEVWVNFNDYSFYFYDIKTIVTKEAYDSVKYSVETD